MKSSTQEELTHLIEFINDSYLGDYAVSRDLSKAIYFFHYLEKDMIDPREVENIWFALHRLSECFYKAHRTNRRYIYQIIEESIGELNESMRNSESDNLWLYSP